MFMAISGVQLDFSPVVTVCFLIKKVAGLRHQLLSSVWYRPQDNVYGVMRFTCPTQPYSTCMVHFCHTALFNLWGTLLPHTLIKLLECTCTAHCYSIYRLHLCHTALFNLKGVLIQHTVIQFIGSICAT